MTGFIVFGVVASCLMCIVRGQGATVNATSQPRGPVASGSTVYVSCRVSNSQMSIVTWYKLPPQSAPTAQPVKLGAGNDVEPIYQQVKRYRINSTLYNATDKEFRFVITGAQMQDSGNYTCSLTPDNINSTAEIIVAANPPAVLEMKLKPADRDEQTVSSGDTATLDPNEILDLTCTARGFPRPTVNLTGPLVTESPSVISNVTNSTSATATPGLNKVEFVASQRLTGTKLRPQNGAVQNVTCSSASPVDGSVQKFVIFFQFNLFAPIIECPTTYTREGAKDVTLSCRVLANPLPSFVSWSFRDPDSSALTLEVKLDGEHHSPKNTFSIRYYSAEDGYGRTNLTLSTPVKAIMFTDYNVKADNTQGSGKGSASLTSGASVMVLSSWMVLMTSLAHLLLACVFVK